jgi:FemAB family
MIQTAEDFTVEIDLVKGAEWSAILSNFSDSNIFQTWSYQAVRSGASSVSQIVLKQAGRIVAAAQARVVKAPLLNIGMAYVRWGPLWKLRGEKAREEVFRQIARALKNEYVGRRGWAIRLLPRLYEGDGEPIRRILEEEGYVLPCDSERYRTIVMDIRPSLEDLSRGFHQKWRNRLNAARKKGLEIVEGEQDDLFLTFESIYDEMQDRKRFVAGAEPAQFRRIQKELPTREKMRVVLCKERGEVCAGAICSALGDTGLYLFGATSNHGTKTNGSYLAQWRIVEWLKLQGCCWYDLNGINPATNEGTYHFKSRLAGIHGREVDFLGEFDAHPNVPFRLLVSFAGFLRAKAKSVDGWSRQVARGIRGA